MPDENKEADEMVEDNFSAELREWDLARKRVSAGRDLATHVGAFVAVNFFLILVWVATGAGYFWPAWIIGAWGIGLIVNALGILTRCPMADTDIEADMRRYEQLGHGDA